MQLEFIFQTDDHENDDAQNEVTPAVSENQSPRVDERIDSAENREMLIIDHGGDTEAETIEPATETEVELEPEPEPEPEQEPEDMNVIDTQDISHQHAEYEDNENHNITTIETSEIENYNEIDDIPDLDYEEEIPMDPIPESKPGTAASVKSGDRNSAQSITSAKSTKSAKSSRSARSIKSTANENQDESKPGSAVKSDSAKTVASAKSDDRITTESVPQSAKSRRSASAASNKSRASQKNVADNDVDGDINENTENGGSAENAPNENDETAEEGETESPPEDPNEPNNDSNEQPDKVSEEEVRDSVQW